MTETTYWRKGDVVKSASTPAQAVRLRFDGYAQTEAPSEPVAAAPSLPTPDVNNVEGHLPGFDD